jgi:hypothetical protein
MGRGLTGKSVKWTVKSNIYNVFNTQGVEREAEGSTVQPGFSFREPYRFQEPRRIHLAVKATF